MARDEEFASDLAILPEQISDAAGVRSQPDCLLFDPVLSGDMFSFREIRRGNDLYRSGSSCVNDGYTSKGYIRKYSIPATRRLSAGIALVYRVWSACMVAA